MLAVKNHPFKHVFHAVMDVSDEADAEPWGKDEKRVTKIVFIGFSAWKTHENASICHCFEDYSRSRGACVHRGKDLDKSWIRENFDECFARLAMKRDEKSVSALELSVLGCGGLHVGVLKLSLVQWINQNAVGYQGLDHFLMK